MTVRTQLPWRVLLIGGSSGVGKTVVAQQLAQQLGVSVLLVDDVRLALQYTTTPKQFPPLHVFQSPTVWQRPPEQLRDAMIAVARTLLPALAIIIAHHVVVEGSGPLIIEGDGILPELVARTEAQHFHPGGSTTKLAPVVRSLFLYEEDEQRIADNMLARGRGFEQTPAAKQHTIVHTSWLYGTWLRDSAIAQQLPALPVRPYDALLDRVLAMVLA